MSALPNDIGFFYFVGETWGYLGSRKFVYDLENFAVQHFPETHSCIPV